MSELKMRLNLDAEEVELVVDGKVAFSSGSDVFRSWVNVYNDKHKPAPVEPVKVEAPVEEVMVNPEAPVVEETPLESPTETLDTEKKD